jgi:hypothetical protein
MVVSIDDYVGTMVKEIPKFDSEKIKEIYLALIARAKGIHDEESQFYVANAKERVKKAHELYEGYQNHMGAFNKLFTKTIDDKFDAKKIHKLVGKHRKAYEARIGKGKKGLTSTQRDKHLRALINQILPQLGYKAEGGGGEEETYNAFVQMFAETAGKREDGKQYIQKMNQGIKSGDALLAAEGIKGVMRVYHSMKHQSDFQGRVFQGDADFKYEHVDHIGDLIEKHSGIEVNKPELAAQKMEDLLPEVLSGQYLELASKYAKDPLRNVAANNNNYVENSKKTA